MHNAREGAASRHINIGSVGYVLDDLAKVDQIGWIDHSVGHGWHATARHYGRARNWDRRIITPKYGVVARDSDKPFVLLCEPIDAEFLVVVERQLANHGAQRDLRCLNVHFVQNLLHLCDHLAIREHDD